MTLFVNSCLKTLQQLSAFVTTLSDDEYQSIPHPYFESSIGQHLRHVVDMYLAVQTGLPSLTIDYDQRRRGSLVERDRQTALHELILLTEWLRSVPNSALQDSVTVRTETDVYTEQQEMFVSTLGREICFVSSHLVHHVAIMAAIARLLGKPTEQNLGVAPATATYLRKQESAC